MSSFVVTFGQSQPKNNNTLRCGWIELIKGCAVIETVKLCVSVRYHSVVSLATSSRETLLGIQTLLLLLQGYSTDSSRLKVQHSTQILHFGMFTMYRQSSEMQQIAKKNKNGHPNKHEENKKIRFALHVK